MFHLSCTSINTVLHNYNLAFKLSANEFCIRGVFLGFWFLDSIFLGFLSVAKYFLVVQKYPTQLIPVFRYAKSTPWETRKLNKSCLVTVKSFENSLKHPFRHCIGTDLVQST